MDDRQERRLEGVERLLREQGPAEFSADFRSGILSAIEKLPDPELLPPPAAQRDWRWFLSLLGTGERVSIGLALVAIVLACTPQFQLWLAMLDWTWGDLTLSMNLGDVALSASLGTILATGLGAMLMAGVGIYSSRNHLIGT
ncbi:hypothetical protein KDL44_04505 [bacterium]|nr:hypothetical protein [bacterium]